MLDNHVHSVLSSKWRRVAVSDVASVTIGGTPSRAVEEYWQGDIPWATAKDVANAEPRYLCNTQEAITEMGLSKSAAKLMPQGTVIITARGTVGALAQLRCDMSFNQTCYALTPTSEIDNNFLYYVLKGTLASMRALTYGTVFQTITKKSFDNWYIPLPRLSEQRTIAQILGTLDDKIELNRRMSETLEETAKALFKSWFIDFDPVRAKQEGRQPPLPAHIADLFPDRLVDSKLGPIPEGWKARSLDEIAHFINGLALQKYPPTDGRSLPIIKIAQLRSGDLTNAGSASTELDPKYIVQDGDILFSWSGSLLCKLWVGGTGALNQHLFKVIPISAPKWLCYFAIHRHLDNFREIAAGKATTMGHIRRHHLSDAKQAIAPQNVTSQLDEMIQPITELMLKTAIETTRLVSLRDTLLPRLISGTLPADTFMRT